MMVSFIDQNRKNYGVESICAQLPIAPSTYYEAKTKQSNPDKVCPRKKRDMELKPEIAAIWEDNYKVYGIIKIWKQLKRQGYQVARCTVARLMKEMGIKGARRGGKVYTTKSDKTQNKPEDLVQRNFKVTKPNQLWIVDFTYVRTWQGFVYVSFVIDAYGRRIIGWSVSRKMTTDFVLDALDQAIYFRKPSTDLIHHSDHGSQYLSLLYTERLEVEGIKPSVGTAGDSYDNAMAESVIGLYKTELIEMKGPWRNLETVEFETLKWIDWFNHRRLFGPIGNIPPAEFEENFYNDLEQIVDEQLVN